MMIQRIVPEGDGFPIRRSKRIGRVGWISKLSLSEVNLIFLCEANCKTEKRRYKGKMCRLWRVDLVNIRTEAKSTIARKTVGLMASSD